MQGTHRMEAHNFISKKLGFVDTFQVVHDKYIYVNVNVVNADLDIYIKSLNQIRCQSNRHFIHAYAYRTKYRGKKGEQVSDIYLSKRI